MAEEHVRGRMPLESNPGNRNPAIPPVFDTTGKEDYRRVSPENPLPTKDKDLDERLTAIENKLDSVIENGALNTQLTGSNDEYVMPVKESSKNQEVISVHQDFECTTNSITVLDYYNVDEFREFFLQVTPSGLGKYRIYYYIRRNNRDSVLGRERASDRDNSHNFASERKQINSSRVAVAVENLSDNDHTFGEIVFVGVRR